MLKTFILQAIKPYSIDENKTQLELISKNRYNNTTKSDIITLNHYAINPIDRNRGNFCLYHNDTNNTDTLFKYSKKEVSNMYSIYDSSDYLNDRI